MEEESSKNDEFNNVNSTLGDVKYKNENGEFFIDSGDEKLVFWGLTMNHD